MFCVSSTINFIFGQKKKIYSIRTRNLEFDILGHLTTELTDT